MLASCFGLKKFQKLSGLSIIWKVGSITSSKRTTFFQTNTIHIIESQRNSERVNKHFFFIFFPLIDSNRYSKKNDVNALSNR